jgi:hypothetical protein
VEVLLVVCTILGGVAAVWFFWDKLRAVQWRRPKFTASPPSKAISRDSNDPVFPPKLEYAVDQALPDYRLPIAADMQWDWAKYADAESLSPFMCSGDFTGSGEKEYAIILVGRQEEKYKIVALTSDGADGLAPHELAASAGRPYNLFVTTVEPGYYKPGPSAVQLGAPRIVRLRRQGINWGKFESADNLVYWDGQKFVEVWMSD